MYDPSSSLGIRCTARSYSRLISEQSVYFCIMMRPTHDRTVTKPKYHDKKPCPCTQVSGYLFNWTNDLNQRALSLIINFRRIHGPLSCEPRHDKTSKMMCAQRRLRSAWAFWVFAMRSICSYGPKLSSRGRRRLWSDWADAQADLSLRWAHTHLVAFVMSRLMFSGLNFLRKKVAG